MKKETQIRIAITSGIVMVILLILVMMLTLSREKSDEDRLDENISEYTGNTSKDIQSTDEAGDISKTDHSKNNEQLTYSEYKDPAQYAVSGNSFYSTNTAVLKDVYNTIKYDRDAQLNELYTYWADSNMDAVRDLVHLERYEAMSYELGSGSDFYYYGDVDEEGIPNGKGLAVYANDQYYFGDFADGKRSGNGTWISFYPYYSNYVVTEHLYSGSFSDDLPSGEGHEHYDYNPDHMNEEDIYLQNAIGSFSGGMYNGDMYVITVAPNGDTSEWSGKCIDGSWEQVMNTKADENGNIAVLTLNENADNHIYMHPDLSKDNGVSGIINGGSPIGN